MPQKTSQTKTILKLHKSRIELPKAFDATHRSDWRTYWATSAKASFTVDLDKLVKFGTNGYGKVFSKTNKAQFIKLNITGPAKNTSIIVREFGVLDIEPNKALYKNIKLNSTKDTNWRFPVEYAVYGNTKTSFGTYSGWKGGEIVIDLDKTEEISSVDFIKAACDASIGGLTPL